MVTSNPLDWDPLTHATQSDVTLWGVARNGDGGLSMLPSAGPIWRHETGEIAGDYTCP